MNYKLPWRCKTQSQWNSEPVKLVNFWTVGNVLIHIRRHRRTAAACQQTFDTASAMSAIYTLLLMLKLKCQLEPSSGVGRTVPGEIFYRAPPPPSAGTLVPKTSIHQGILNCLAEIALTDKAVSCCISFKRTWLSFC